MVPGFRGIGGRRYNVPPMVLVIDRNEDTGVEIELTAKERL